MMQCPSPSGPGAYLVPDLDQIWQKLVGVCGGEAGGDAAVKYLLHSAGGEELPRRWPGLLLDNNGVGMARIPAFPRLASH